MRVLPVLALSLSLLLLAGCDSDDNLFPPPADGDLVLTAYASGFSQPVHITHAGDGSGRLFVVERAGTVRVIDADTVQEAPFLDITAIVVSGASEQGLLSIAFPPGFDSEDGHFYAFYTSVVDGGLGIAAGDTVISRFHLSNGIADPASEEILLIVEQPFVNHNGGQLAFGADGYLYIGLGDGGSGGDPQGHGQDRLTLLGTILRIDVESGLDPYQVPQGNPFLGDPNGLDEIWAWGLRNPWRFSFDRQTGDLYIGDVGQGAREEINLHPALPVSGGINYGWNIMEGSLCFPTSVTDCDQTGLTLPIAEYGHAGGGCSGAVTGGFVYRGTAWPDLQGIYLYGDYCTGVIRGFPVNPGGAVSATILLDTGLAISTLGEDEAGELYLAAYQSGDIYRIDLQ